MRVATLSNFRGKGDRVEGGEGNKDIIILKLGWIAGRNETLALLPLALLFFNIYEGGKGEGEIGWKGDRGIGK